MHDLLEVIKMAALDAVAQTKPCDLRFGTVETGKPLAVRLSDRLLLTEKNLILLQNVVDFTAPDGTVYPRHLTAGETVVLLRKPGGMKYLILGRKG